VSEHQSTEQDKIAQLEWAIAVLALKYLENESEATVILPARSLGIYAGFDVELNVTAEATTIYVKVHR
jgi:hypothetical protein